jgi:hypothetical protein
MNPNGKDFSNRMLPNEIIEFIMRDLGEVDLQSAFLTSQFWKERVISLVKKNISEIENSINKILEKNLIEKSYESKLERFELNNSLFKDIQIAHLNSVFNLDQENVDTLESKISPLLELIKVKELELKSFFDLRKDIGIPFSRFLEDLAKHWFEGNSLNNLLPNELTSDYIVQIINQHKTIDLFKKLNGVELKRLIIENAKKLGKCKSLPNEYMGLKLNSTGHFLGSNREIARIICCIIEKYASSEKFNYSELSIIIALEGGDKEAALFFCNKIENRAEYDTTLESISNALVKRDCLHKAIFYAEKIIYFDKRNLVLEKIWA